MRNQITAFLVLGLASYGAAAQKILSEAPGGAGKYPAEIRFAPGAEPDFVPGAVLLKQQDAFKYSKDVILQHSEADPLGQQHFRYQQKLNGIPVEGAVYIVH